MIKSLFSILIFIALLNKGYTQKNYQFSVATMSEAIGLPFTNYLPIHPGLELKGSLKAVEKQQSYSYLSINLGGFYHQSIETSFYLGGEYLYTYKLLKEKVGIDIPVGLGYLHTFYPNELYEQTENGDFVEVSQFGRPHAYVNLGVGLSYIGSRKINPFIRQELFIETPFANGLPIIPHSLLKIGINIRLGNND